MCLCVCIVLLVTTLLSLKVEGRRLLQLNFCRAIFSVQSLQYNLCSTRTNLKKLCCLLDKQWRLIAKRVPVVAKKPNDPSETDELEKLTGKLVKLVPPVVLVLTMKVHLIK